MNKLEVTQKEYQILNLLLINVTGKRDFPSHQKDWEI